MLEKIGLPISWALNLPSIFGFTLLLFIIYLLGKKVFESKAVGVLSAIFFLFNGSFSFLEFFKINPLNTDSLTDIVTSNAFSSFGPYDGKIISAFWNLNIYTNQRHLALSYAAFLLILYFIYKFSQKPKSFSYKSAILLGIFVGIFPFIHLAVFAMIGILLISSFLIYPKIRSKIIIAGAVGLILAVPQILYMGASQVKADLFNPGYLISELTFINFIEYWFLNIGILMILLPVGLVLSNKEKRKIFLPFLILFAVGNLFQFSPEIAANHKFFNLFVIGANFFAAFVLVKIWNAKLFGKLISIPLFVIITFSGILDLFPILNDSYATITDLPNSATASFIKNHTVKDSVFLNGSYLYNPASLAGRKIYLGWPYFSWSAGYDTDSRFSKMKTMLTGESQSAVCNTLKEENIDFVEIQNPTGLEGININYEFFAQFVPVYVAAESNLSVYQTESICNI
jgi:hypothetical protein